MFGFGREAVSSAEVALPTFREGRSAAFIPGAPKLEGLIAGILFEVYACLGLEALVTWVSSQRWQLSSMSHPVSLAALQASVDERTNAEEHVNKG